MKLLRLAAVLLSTVMLAAALPSCGDVNETSYTVSVIVKTPKHDDKFGEKVENMSVLLETTHCTIKTAAGEQPTLLEAITTALEQENIRYTTDEASITSIKNNSERYKTEKFKYTETDSFGNSVTKEDQQRYVYYWAYTIKHEGEEAFTPENRANETFISNGDHIVCYYTPSDPGAISGVEEDTDTDGAEDGSDVIE